MKVAVVRLFGALLCLCLGSGCATPGKSAGEGALIGGGAGMAGGAAFGNFRSVVIGTVAGSALGAGTGYLIGQGVQDQNKSAYAQGEKDEKQQTEQSDGAPAQEPKLIPAKTEAHWVPDQVRGDTFVPGHFEYRILQKAHWEAPQ